MERFLAEVCSPEWNRRQDAGRTWAEAVETLVAEHPEQADLIRAYRSRWVDMLGGPIEGTVAIFDELRERGVPLFALSNWSTETWPLAVERFAFLGGFTDILISGEAGVAKPDPRIYRILIERDRLDPTRTVFIDDVPANVDGAHAAGFVGIVYNDPDSLRRELVGLGQLA